MGCTVYFLRPSMFGKVCDRVLYQNKYGNVPTCIQEETYYDWEAFRKEHGIDIKEWKWHTTGGIPLPTPTEKDIIIGDLEHGEWFNCYKRNKSKQQLFIEEDLIPTYSYHFTFVRTEENGWIRIGYGFSPDINARKMWDVFEKWMPCNEKDGLIPCLTAEEFKEMLKDPKLKPLREQIREKYPDGLPEHEIVDISW